MTTKNINSVHQIYYFSYKQHNFNIFSIPKSFKMLCSSDTILTSIAVVSRKLKGNSIV